MLEVVGRLILGGVLAGASAAKLASPGSSRLAMATFGVSDPRAQWLLGWVAWRQASGRRDFLRARSVADPARPGPVRTLSRAGGAAQLGRPSLDGDRLVYAKATKRRNAIVGRRLGGDGGSTLMRSRSEGLSNPSVRGGRLLYVRHEHRADKLKLALLGGGEGRTLLRSRGGTLWSTALGPDRAYVTQIHGTAPRQRILSVKRGH